MELITLLISEQCGQITRHASHFNSKCRRHWRGHSNGTEGGDGGEIAVDSGGLSHLVAFMGQKHKLGSSNADCVTVFDKLAPYGDSIHEGAVTAVKIDELIMLVELLEHAVPAGDGGIGETQLICFVTANEELAFDEMPDGAWEGT